MAFDQEHLAVRQVVRDYLEGMIWGDEDKLRSAFHPQAIQAGHFQGTYEFFPLDQFIDWVKSAETVPPGTPYIAELISIEITGSVAVVRVDNTCFGADFTDYLVLVKDKPDATGKWQIVTKAYHAYVAT